MINIYVSSIVLTLLTHETRVWLLKKHRKRQIIHLSIPICVVVRVQRNSYINLISPKWSLSRFSYLLLYLRPIAQCVTIYWNLFHKVNSLVHFASNVFHCITHRRTWETWENVSFGPIFDTSFWGTFSYFILGDAAHGPYLPPSRVLTWWPPVKWLLLKH